MTGTVTRRAISLNWTYALNMRLRPPVFSPNSTRVELPLVEYLPDNKDAGGFLGSTIGRSIPEQGYLIKREGYEDIIIAYDASISIHANNVAGMIAALLGDAEALGLVGPLAGIGGNQNEAIVIYLNSDPSDGIAAGHYLDLDRHFRGMNWVSGEANGPYRAAGEGTNNDYDFIEVRYPNGANGQPLDPQYATVGYVSTVIHELFHRRYYGHDYNTLFASYSERTARNFLSTYDEARAADDPVYARTRDVLVQMYRDRRFSINGLFFGDPGAPSDSAYREGLVNADRNLLKDVAAAADQLRLARLYTQGKAMNWAGLSIADLQSLVAAGDLILPQGADPNNRSAYRSNDSQLIPFLAALSFLQGKRFEEAPDLNGLSAEVAAIAIRAMTAGHNGSVCGTYLNVGGQQACTDLRDQYNEAKGGASFLPNALVLIAREGTSLTFALGEASGGREVEVVINAETGELTSFKVDGSELVGILDDATLDLLNAAMRMANRLSQQPGQDPGSVAGGIPLPITFDVITNADGSVSTVVSVDLGVVAGLTGLRVEIQASGGTSATKITRRTTADGITHIEREDEFTRLTVKSTQDGIVTLKLKDSPLGVDFADAGSILGSVLGSRIAGEDELAQIVTSAALKAVGANLGDVLNDLLFNSASQRSSLGELFRGIEKEFFQNALSGGIGAVSSLLTARLIEAVGVDGVAGEIAQTAVSGTIGQILTNLTRLGQQIPGAANGEVFKLGTGVDFALIGNAVGSYLGTKLAAEIISFDTVGGQLGASIGSSLGVLAAGKLLGDAFAVLGMFGGPLGAAIGAFVGFIVGGLIGSLFGGTPRSGADVEWDSATSQFVVANAYSRKGGSKDAAKGMASAVADTFNGVIAATGGTLLNPGAVQSGNYGMRKSDFVYRPTATRDKDAITQRFSGDDGASRLIGYGIYQGLTDPDFQIAGGSNHVKRALYRTFEIGAVNPRNFDPSVLLGNIAAGEAYERYLADRDTINAIVAAKPDSVFAAEVAVTLARAYELGLHKRHTSDWFGGFNHLLTEAATTAATVGLGFQLNPLTDQVSRVIAVGPYLLGDSIDETGQTMIKADDGNNHITLSHSPNSLDKDGVEYAVAGGADRIVDVTGLTINGKATDDSPVAVDVAATIDAGGGDDVVHAGDLGNNVFGGAGNDTLYGGRLDDWLLGGDGNDSLHAGAQAGGLGGDGNYLNGGAGDDQLHGREGSDWLEGGEGTDRLVGGAGGDILAGGAGAGDDLEGGSGDDIYLFRLGDGADGAEDQADAAPVRDPAKAGDAISQRFAGIAAALIKRDWLARSGGVAQGKIAGGEDAIHFGLGVELGDVQLAKGANGRDLIVRLSQVDPETGAEAPTGDVLTIADWFSDPFKRVEWLKFADGTEVRIGDVTSFIVGTGGDDVLIGTAGKDFVHGGGGNDELYLLAGDDIGSGGTGDDLVSGGADNDLIVGGMGVDKLIGGSGNDALSGDAGGDDLYGGKGNDILSGGRGDGDMLAGGAGDDRFKYARGDGHDIVIDDYSDHWAVIWQNGQWAAGYDYIEETSEVVAPDGTYLRKNFGTAAAPDLRWVGRFDYDEQTRQLKHFAPPAGASTTVSNKGVDTIEFALDINIQDIVLTRPAGTDDIRLTVARENNEGAAGAGADSITLKDYYDAPGALERLAFYQTGEIDISATGYRLVAGSNGADGTDAAPLTGSAGRDWITGAGGDDVVAGGAGDDIVAGNAGSDRLKGEGGNDVLYGGAGNDMLDGGFGDDILSGGAGMDTASYASAAGGVSAFLTETAMNRGDALRDTYDSIENLLGGAGADTLGGDEGDNELAGGMGSDLLLGGRGSDTYVWNIGDGSDAIDDAAFTARQVIGSGGELLEGYTAEWTRGALRSGSGSNARYYWQLEVTGPDGAIVYTYDYFTPKGDEPAMPGVKSWPDGGWMDGLESSGAAVGGIVYDRSVDAGEADAIELGAGISLSDLAFERDGNDLVISYVTVDDGNSGNGNAIGASRSSSLTVRGHFTANGRIETLIFADGLSVALDSVITATSSTLVQGTAGADLIVGQRGVRVDTLDGGEGNDVIAGGEGDDVLRGAAGDDVIEGGAGADRIDGGAHTPYDPAAAEGAPQRRGDEVRYATSAAGVTIDLAATAAQTGGDAQGDILSNIENVTASAHADIVRGNGEANLLRGLAGDDQLDGRDGDDVLTGDDGNDRLQGGAGEDNLSGGEGNDELSGGLGKDLLAGDAGNDRLSGEDGDDILTADAGDDRLDGGAGADSLIAGEGADLLLGGEGNDTLAGEGGNDDLQGGEGDDGYSFKAGFGHDVLTDAAGRNEILIDASIPYDRLWLEQKGDDLLISVRGSSDTLTVRNFFAAAQPGRIYSIQTATHRLFLHHADTRNFIAAMTAASAAGIPAEIPAGVAALMPRYWHPGTKATPYAVDIAVAIDEDHDTGTLAFGAIDHDENIAGYRVGTPPAHGAVTIGAGGAFVFTPTANFNGADSFTLIVTDADNLAREITVSVTVAAVDDAPVIEAATLAIDEQALRSQTAVGDLVGQLVAHEYDGEAIVFSLTDDAGARFAISADGKLSVRDADRLDHEQAGEHQVTVRVTDAVGTWTERAFTIAIGDVNEENALPAAYAWNVDENVAQGTLIGRVTAGDLDKPEVAFGEQRYHFWHGDAAHELSADGRFRIDTLSGEITVADALDHEAPAPIAQHEVIARDDRGAAGGHESRTIVTIAITDLNEANTIPAAYGFSVAENETAGIQVGAVAATDPDNEGTAFANQRYYFWDGATASAISSDGRFAIDEVSGAIFAREIFDYESGVREATYQVVARDNRGDAPFHAAVTAVTIALANVNETPETPVLDYAAGEVLEGAAAGTVIARFSLADPDRTVPALVPETNPGGLFSVAGGELRLAADLDFEDLVALGFAVGDADGDGRNDVTVSLDLHASDGALRSAGSAHVSVVLEDVNEAPTSFGFEAALADIAERDRPATGSALPAVVIGSIHIADEDTPGFANASYSYTVDDPRFEIVGNLLRLREGVALDFEQEEQVSLTVVATDGSVDPISIDRTFTFAVGDRDDILDGTQDADLLEGQKGRDIIRGLAGDDELRGHAGADNLHGDDGADLVLGGDGADSLDGGSDDDRLEGGAGDDLLAGGSGGDTLLGGTGSDTIAGDGGDDLIVADEDGGAVRDRIEGGAGSDTLSYRHFASGVNADLAAASVAGDTVTGVENVEGTQRADSLAGDGEANQLSGLGGDDVLVGRGGDDQLSGGLGNDELAGGAGGDILSGGAGGDLLSGGADNDTLFGGADGDTLLGEGGDDLIEGGAGNDVADGGGGDDTYIIDRQSHHDTIFNYDATGDDIDVIGFKDTYGLIEERDLWFERQGDDLLVTVIGADATVLVKNWYVEADADSRANHRIDFFIAGEKYSRDTDVAGLVDFMADFAKPADQDELDALLSDPDYEVKVATYFGINAPPTISGFVDQRFDEGGSVLLTLTVSDDITPEAGISVKAELLSGGELFDPGAMELGTVGSDGRLTLRLAPGIHRAGTAIVALTAEDAGGISVTQQIVLTVDPVATTPLVTQFVGGSGTSGGAGVALSLSVEFPDRDGSELHEVLIAGVPSGVSLSRGSFDAASGAWKLAPAELAGLSLLAPQGWSQDLQLTVTARASESGKVADATAVTTVVFNAPPTGVTFAGAVNESSANGAVVGSLQGIDADIGEKLTYVLLDGADGRFALAPDGTLSVADASKIDYETAQAHAIRVRVTDSFGEAIERVVTIPIANANEANSLPSRYSLALDENLAGGTVVGQVQASDADAAGHAFAEQRYYFRVGNGLQSTSADGLFVIDDRTGAIVTTRALDYETHAPGDYEVVALDNRGGAGANSASTTVSIALRNLNEANGLAASINLSVLENQGVGTLVGTVQASDFDSPAHPFGEQRYFFLVNGDTSETSADGRFTIDPVSGQVRTTRLLNRESADASTSHVVVARDNRGTTPFNQVTASLGVAVDNQNEHPDLPHGPASAMLDEVGGANPAVGGALVASYALSDRDGPAPALVFAAGGNPNDWFRISGNEVRIAAGVSLTFQAARDWAASQGIQIGDADCDGRADVRIGSVVVRASDGALESGDKRTDIYIEDVAQGPNAPAFASETRHSETLAGQPAHAGQVIATFTQSDPDGPTPALAIVGGNGNDWFAAVGGQLVFAPNVNFTADWLRQNAGTLGVGAGFSSDVDGDGLKEIRVASIDLASRDADGNLSGATRYDVLIEDMPEAPVFVGGSLTLSVDEGTAGHVRLGQVAGSDVDGPASELRYSFDGASVAWNAALGRNVSASGDGRLLMDHVTGEVFTAPGVPFQAEGGPLSVSYGVRVVDRLGGQHSRAATASLVVGVNPVNEPHSLINAAGAIDEVEGLPPLVERFNLRNLMLSDPEGQNMVWTFADGSSVNGIWTLTSDGKLTLTDGRVDYEQLTTRYETVWEWDDRFQEPMERTIAIRDHSLATMNLAVTARDPETGVTREATFTATVRDVNEGPVLTSTRQYYITDDDDEDNRFGTMFGRDPDTGSTSVTFHIDAASVQMVESQRSRGDSSDVDNTDYPYVYVKNGNQLWYEVPGDGEWEGGIRNHPVLGGRWYFQLDYSFDIVMTDWSGVAGRQRINVTFLKHGVHSAPPIVFDLDGDGLELVSLIGSTVMFDMDADGLKDRTGWIAADDGVLALDRNGNGTIDDIGEISFASDVPGAASDLEGLGSYDSNGNGLLDQADARFGEFRIWRDLDQDGVSQEGELLGLIEAGVESVNLAPTMTGDQPPSNDNVVFATASYARVGGGTGTVGDVFLTYERTEPSIAAPVILDFDGDGTSLISLAASTTRFDMDGDGATERTGWFEAGDAILALDRDGDGAIAGIAEISFVADKQGAKTDLEGLQAFDSNANGVIDPGDKKFAAFRLWSDANSNGVTDAGELKSLAEAGVAGLSLSATAPEGAAGNVGGNIVYGRGSFAFADGKVGTLLDVGLAYLPEDGSTAPVVSTATPQTGLNFAVQSFDRKAKKYMVSAIGGQLVLSLRKAGPVDPRAGIVSGATILDFANGSVGMLSPIILDLDGDGIEMRSRKRSKARFDMDGDGVRDDTGWTGKDDGFLVIDRNGDGLVNDGSELSFLTESPGAKSDLQALASLDSNKDGSISAADKRFGELKIWVDGNGNGVTDAGELKTLGEHGIASISLAGRASEVQAKVGSNVLLATSTFTRTDGSVGSVGDAALAFKPDDDGLGPQSELLQALRARLQDRSGGIDGSIYGAGADPFAMFGGAGAQALASLGADAGAAEPDPDAARVALMTQELVAFGAGRGEGPLDRRDRAAPAPLDYFA